MPNYGKAVLFGENHDTHDFVTFFWYKMNG